MKKNLILFYYPKSEIFLDKKEIKELKKNFSEIFIYKNNLKYDFKLDNHEMKNLNKIKKKYDKLRITLDIKKIYQINLFLKNLKINKKRNNIFVSPYYISNIILEEEFIFYELSKIYKIQFIRPELSFIKNRYILSKNLYKQPYTLKKKTNISKENFNKFKINYICSMQKFYENNYISKKYNIFNLFVYIFGFLFKFRFNSEFKNYSLIILNNNNYLEAMSNLEKEKNYVNQILKKMKIEMVFLLHPNSNPFTFFFKLIKKNNFFFQNKKIVFLHKPKNLQSIIQKSKFIIHLSSSLSAQSLIFDKKILCVGKNLMYLKYINNVVLNISQNKLNSLEKKLEKQDIFKTSQFLINTLSNSVNNFGQFKLSLKKKDYSSNLRLEINNQNDKNIIKNLLKAI